MNDIFTLEDRLEGLRISQTGVWRLESQEGAHVRFYGDEIMKELVGGPKNMSGEEMFDFFMAHIHKDDMKMFMDYYTTLKTQTHAEVVYRYDHPELGVIYVRCVGKTSAIKSGVHYYRGFHQNVTDTVRIEQENRRRVTKQAEMYKSIASKIMEHSSDSTARINIKTGEFEWLNEIGEKVDHNLTYKEMFAQIYQNVPEEYREAFGQNANLDNIKKQLENSSTYSFSTFVHRPSDKELRRVTYRYYVMDNDPDYILSLYGDTTQDYVKEQQLAEALLMARQANNAKTVFLNNMSHDIRTPMNAIIGFNNLAKTHIEDRDRCMDYLDKIDTSSHHLLNLINDVLDMSRIESGRMKLVEENCSIKEIINGLKIIFQNDAASKGLKLTVDSSQVKDEYVWGDKLRINQILINCVSNAIKFTGEGGSVDIAVGQNTCTREGYGEYVFTISDTGIGMSKEYLTRIFDPFSREENKVHKIEGTGLGMSICKSIVEMMDGNIEVESEQGVGSTFTITIRLRISKEMSMEKETDISYDLDDLIGRRILLAEDNEMNTEIAIIILEEAGFQVDHAEDGQKCVEMLENAECGYYDFILMDIQMPNMNGYEATRAIRKMNNAKANIPIIAMTANAFEEDKKLAKDAGMNEHIAKPVDIKKLMCTITSIVGDMNI